MKNRGSVFLKQILSVLSSVSKAKSLAVKSKTSAMKTRFIIFSLLKNKKVLMSAISHKIHALLGQEEKDRKEQNGDDGNDQDKAIILYSEMGSELNHAELAQAAEECHSYYYQDDDDKYPDLTHCLFDLDEEDLGDQNQSVIDVVKNSKENQEDFSLEDEIDQVADLFIKRFHRRMKMQKWASFKRHQEMLECIPTEIDSYFSCCLYLFILCLKFGDHQCPKIITPTITCSSVCKQLDHLASLGSSKSDGF